MDRGVVLYGRSLDVFVNLGLRKVLTEKGCILPAWSYTNDQGSLLCKAPADTDFRLRRVVSVRQADLIRLLLDPTFHRDLLPLQVLFGAEMGYVEGNNRTGMYGDNPLRVSYSVPEGLNPSSSSSGLLFSDFIVASDGTHSTARRQHSPSSRDKYFQFKGIRTHTGIGDGLDLPANNEPVVMVDKRGHRFSMFPLQPATSPKPGHLTNLHMSGYNSESRGDLGEESHGDAQNRIVTEPVSTNSGGTASHDNCTTGPTTTSFWWTFTIPDYFADVRDAQTKTFGMIDPSAKENIEELFDNFADPARSVIRKHVLNPTTPILTEYIFEDSREEWSKNCVAYIGTAAVALHHNLFQETVLAVEDAWELTCCLSRMTHPECIAKHQQQLRGPKEKGKKDLLSIANCFFKYGKLRAYRIREYRRVNHFVNWLLSPNGTWARSRLLPRLAKSMKEMLYDAYLLDSLGGAHFQLCGLPPHFLEAPDDGTGPSADMKRKQSPGELDDAELSAEQRKPQEEQAFTLKKWVSRLPIFSKRTATGL